MATVPASTALPTEGARKTILGRYVSLTGASKSAHERAARSLPGGVNRNIVYQMPHPVFFARGQGPYIEDLDGRRYLDMIGNYTAMILGHRNAMVEAAVEAQIRCGTAWAGPSPLEAELAELIMSRLPSIRRIRFTSSGTEATMMAVRAARARTGRPLIAKFEGGYHGLHDYAMVSVAPPLDAAGPADRPVAVAAAGIPPEVRDTVLVLPYNRPESVAAIIERHASRLAGIIVEPILGVSGIISPKPEFLRLLRELTARYGILLIFDEVISLRVAYGGAQEACGVRPDLTTLGKIIGGGFPVGALGGSEDAMQVFEPSSGPAVLLSGTFHASPVTLAAGIATLKQLTAPAIEALNARGERLRDRLRALLATASRPVQLTGVGSLFNLHVTSRAVDDYRSMASGDRQMLYWLYMALLNEGVCMAPRGMGCLSIPMRDEDVDGFVRALSRAMAATGLH